MGNEAFWTVAICGVLAIAAATLVYRLLSRRTTKLEEDMERHESVIKPFEELRKFREMHSSSNGQHKKAS